MAITFVSSTEQATQPDASPITFTFDIGTRTNGLLVVLLATVNNATFTLSTPTYGGVAMSIAVNVIREAPTSVFKRVTILYLANPPNGSNEFSITHNIGAPATAFGSYVLPAWFDGAHQTQASVLDQTNSGNGTTDPSLTITPTENDELIVSLYWSEANTPLTVGAGETLLQDHDFGARVTGGSYVIQTTAGTQTMDWAGVDDEWDMALASFKAAAAAPSAVKTLTLLGVG